LRLEWFGELPIFGGIGRLLLTSSFRRPTGEA
jgi:hypothetical protein